MNPADITLALHILLGLFVLVWFIWGPWQRLVSDGVRQRLFELRDQLFDLAVEGRIKFDDPAYRYVRSRINANIRFAHKATIWRVIASAPVVHRFPKPPSLPATEPGVGTELQRILRRNDLMITGAMWLRSPLFIAATVLAAIPGVWALILTDRWAWLKRVYTKFSSTITQEALADRGRSKVRLWQPSSFL